VLGRVFGWQREAFLGAEPLARPRFAAAEARFKMPARRVQSATSLYAVYANYLAIIVLRDCEKFPKHHVPAEAKEFRRALLASYGAVSLQTALRFSWDLGIPVLPLKDPGTFHGACWRYEGRNVIVLKQASKHEARWLFDLVHELLHAAKAPEALTLEVIEADETSEERRNSTEEVEASQFAGDVTLDGRAEELAQACVKAARGSVERLKQVVPSIAERSGVSVGALANYMAFRLSWQNITWWGTAANLQKEDADPYTVARAVFLERFPFSIESTLDRELLERALH
jgi:Zn-dependent peptidase ImmA (M78 family)